MKIAIIAAIAVLVAVAGAAGTSVVGSLVLRDGDAVLQPQTRWSCSYHARDRATTCVNVDHPNSAIVTLSHEKVVVRGFEKGMPIIFQRAFTR
jgi:hypothetical protein